MSVSAALLHQSEVNVTFIDALTSQRTWEEPYSYLINTLKRLVSLISTVEQHVTNSAPVGTSQSLSHTPI